jgi:hypothetical protein
MKKKGSKGKHASGKKCKHHDAHQGVQASPQVGGRGRGVEV